MGACCGADNKKQEVYLNYSGNMHGIKSNSQRRHSIEERKHQKQRIDLNNCEAQQLEISKFI